jgi:hypothetical protein
MKIFNVVEGYEGYEEINYPATVSRLEPVPVTPNQWGVITSIWDEVTFIRIGYKYFEYLN